MKYSISANKMPVQSPKQLYLKYQTSQYIWVGLGHHYANLVTLLAEASFLGRTAIIPKLTLAGIHNNGKSIVVCPSKYFSFTSLKPEVQFIFEEEWNQKLKNFTPTMSEVDEFLPTQTLEKMNCDLIVRESKNHGGIFSDTRKSNSEVSDNLDKICFLLKPSDEVSSLAYPIIDKLKNFDAIHVRRGDLLDFAQRRWWLYPNFDYRTRPEGIRNRVANWIENGRTVYIMTDEKEVEFFSPLKKFYKIVLFRDFPYLKALKDQDNYLLVSVEKLVFSHANIQVSMYNSLVLGSVSPKYSLLDYGRHGSTSFLSRFLNLIYENLKSLKSWTKSNVKNKLLRLRKPV